MGKEHRQEHDCSRHLIAAIEHIVISLTQSLNNQTAEISGIPPELRENAAIYVPALGSRVYLEDQDDNLGS